MTRREPWLIIIAFAELRIGCIVTAYLLAISSAAYHGGMLRQLTVWWYQGHGHLSTIPQSKRVWTTQAQWGYDGRECKSAGFNVLSTMEKRLAQDEQERKVMEQALVQRLREVLGDLSP